MFENMSENEVIEFLKGHDDLYELGQPELEDVQYDILKREAMALYPENDYFKTVGSSAGAGDKVKLPYILGSATKIKADGTTNQFLADKPGDKVVSLKLDGVSLYAEYVEGKVVKAYTRGDGEVGRDITNKAKIFLKDLPTPATVKVRGEAILTGTNHTDLGYKTRRNGVAGLLNNDGTENCDKIDCMFYELIDDVNGVPELEDERLARMQFYGLPVVHYQVFVEGDLNEELLTDHYRACKEDLPFDIDGLIITLNDSVREDTFYPDDKVAFKVNEDSKPCKVVEIELNTSRTGRIVPVVIIEPTDFGGVTVERVTGFNIEFLETMGINVGAVIGVVRSGDVIPYITDIFERVAYAVPTSCPACGSVDVARKGVDIVCTNYGCTAQAILRVEHFLRTLGAGNLTEKTLSKLPIKGIHDCYGLDEFDIADLEGFGMRRAEQIIYEIGRTLKTTPDKFLAANGIPGVGRTASQTILKVYDFDTLINGKLTHSDLTKIDGIGDVLAKNLLDNLQDVVVNYNFMIEQGMEWATASNTLQGKVFCLTGNGCVKRDVLTKMIEANGGYVKGMSKKVDFLVTNDPESQSGKAKKAREYGKPVISYEQILAMLEA